jgi:hypothetical protein
MRFSSALSMGLTQRTRWTVFRLLLPCFFARLDCCSVAAIARGFGAVQAAVWLRDRASARFYLALPKRQPPPLLPRLIAAERRFLEIEVFRYSP